MRRLCLISLLLATVLCLAGTVMAFTGGEQFFISQDQKQLESADKTRALGIDSDRNWRFAGGSLVPAVTNSLDLGSSSLKWRKAYLASLLYADGGIDRSSAAALAIGATHATSVVITPATTITGALTATGGITGAGNIAFLKEVAHTISVGATTTADTAGANLTIAPGAGNGTGNGGALALNGGAKGSGGGDGTVTLGATNTSGVLCVPDLTTSGHVIIGTAAKGLKIKEGGGAATMGEATLSSGAVQVSTTAVATGSRIFVSGQGTGACYVKNRVNGTSFDIYSTDVSDSGNVDWVIIQSAP